MRKIININDGWTFKKQNVSENVDLPHCWNAEDGQNGADYYRGECFYERVLPKTSGKTFIEINAANSVCKVFVNDREAGSHRGGYSMFRVDITDFLTDGENKIKISVDNSDFKDVYPSMADFTFYGGLYRDVNLITDLGECRFSLEQGRCGVLAAPCISDEIGSVNIRGFIDGAADDVSVVYRLSNAEGNTVCEFNGPSREPHAQLRVENPVLWNGVKNPYLYTLDCLLVKNYEEGESDKVDIIDAVSQRIGFRTVTFDSEKGCFLNGEPIKLKGVARHQDREHMGNALTEKEHREDIEIIKEVGANSIRLAHYQHDHKFYDMCDEAGFLVWAEIPVISRFSPKKQDNAQEQLEELITQNYNHPSIYCWGIQNEITIGGKAKGAEEGVRALNRLAKALDPLRPTAQAQLMMYPIDGSMNGLTDIQGYNNYLGWYMQTFFAIDGWLDDFHKKRPEIKLCLSEYGAEGITRYQNNCPTQGDYSETYQALFHEHYIKAICERDWLFGSYVWNMFDFGAANRDEGGVKGRNNKGLVTFDRKTRKDSFYVYKAYWSDEPFVQIAGERFKERPVGKTFIKVYTNDGPVKLKVNGKSYSDAYGEKVVSFKEVEIIEGENVIEAVTENAKHSITVFGTATPNPEYVMKAGGASMVRNWFVNDPSEGIKPDYFSVNDKIGELLKNEEVLALIKANIGNKIPKILFTLVKPFKVSTLIKLMRVDKGMVSIANQYLQTIKKTKI